MKNLGGWGESLKGTAGGDDGRTGDAERNAVVDGGEGPGFEKGEAGEATLAS